ncbi:MAG: glutamate formimidoyltransferase [Candidatus Poseidoniales archaeon]|nr:MAG: glutamate formimidoyltransferase [Candidatus Poseidoniales archaeon]
MHPLVECVPNISEGRDAEKIQRIVAAASTFDGCSVLGVEPDADYNRTVITIAGSPESVASAAFALVSMAIAEIDMRSHSGEHPRLGAVDVCPFVPLADTTMDQCAELARSLAKRVAEELDVPTFLYGAAATHPAKSLLSSIRKGEYEGLENRLTNGNSPHDEHTRYPDFGPRDWSEGVARSGGLTFGAREILVAYNVNLNESDAKVARLVGSLVRSSGRLVKKDDGRRMRIPGSLPMVQGMGVPLESHGISQVSMNLRDVNQCPMHVAFEACKSIAMDHGVEVPGSEVVGLVPLSAILTAGQWYAKDGETNESALVDAAIRGLGLDNLNAFDPKERIIEYALKEGEIE